MAIVKLSRAFYTWLLTGTWILCAILALQFRAAEGLSLLFVFLAGAWGRLFASLLPSEVAYTVASGMTILLVALGLDYFRVQRRTWLRSTGFCASLSALLIAFFYFMEALGESSLSGAAAKFNFDRPTAIAGYLLFCLSGGLLIGSVLALVVAWVQKSFQRVRLPCSPDPLPPRSTSAPDHTGSA